MSNKTIFLSALLIFLLTHCAEVKPIEPKSYLITDGYGISWSKLDRTKANHQAKPWVFHEWSKQLKLREGAKVLISSTPDGKGLIAVDDGILVNGKKYSSLYAGFYGDARLNIGRSSHVSYKGVDPINITNDIRRDGWIHIQLLDWGVLYTSSRLYLVIM